MDRQILLLLKKKDTWCEIKTLYNCSHFDFWLGISYFQHQFQLVIHSCCFKLTTSIYVYI